MPLCQCLVAVLPQLASIEWIFGTLFLDIHVHFRIAPRSSPHHVAQHRPTGSEITPPYAPRSSRFGSEPPSVEDDVDIWRYAIPSCMPETTSGISEAETTNNKRLHLTNTMYMTRI